MAIGDDKLWHLRGKCDECNVDEVKAGFDDGNMMEGRAKKAVHGWNAEHRDATAADGGTPHETGYIAISPNPRYSNHGDIQRITIKDAESETRAAAKA